MKALKFTAVRKSEIVDVPVPVPTPGQVLVKVKAAGICASDVMAYKGEHTYRVPPVITGHELAGEVVETGPEVSVLKAGDRVAIEPHIGCGACYLCRHGNYNVCLNKGLIGVGDWIGAFAEYVVADEPMCHVIPDKMSYEEGAALEPFCVGFHAVRRAHMNLGERVAILGCGTIGLMTLLSANRTGPETLITTDVSPFKRETALQCGADVAIDPMAQDSVAEVLQATDGIGVDTAFVAVEIESVLNQSFQMCRRMGKVVLIASYGGSIAFAPREIQLYERELIGTGMYTCDDYRSAIKLWEKGDLDLNALINKRISLDEAPEMVARLADNQGPDAVKIIIMFD